MYPTSGVGCVAETATGACGSEQSTRRLSRGRFGIPRLVCHGVRDLPLFPATSSTVRLARKFACLQIIDIAGGARTGTALVAACEVLKVPISRGTVSQ